MIILTAHIPQPHEGPLVVGLEPFRDPPHGVPHGLVLVVVHFEQHHVLPGIQHAVEGGLGDMSPIHEEGQFTLFAPSHQMSAQLVPGKHQGAES